MKKIIIAALLGLSVQVATAQTNVPPAAKDQTAAPQGKGRRNNGTPEDKATAMVKRYTKRLSLTPEQQAKIYDITLATIQEGEALRQEASENRQAKMEKRKAMMEESEAKIKQLLNPDQIKQFDMIKAERIAKMEERMNERRSQGGGVNNDMGGGY